MRTGRSGPAGPDWTGGNCCVDFITLTSTAVYMITEQM